jgi:hypothetical protein
MSEARGAAILFPGGAGYRDYFADSSFQFVRRVVAWQYVWIQRTSFKQRSTDSQACLADDPFEISVRSVHLPAKA